MPKVRKNASQSEEEFNCTQSASQTQSSSVSADDLNNYANSTLRYIINAAQNSNLIRRQNIVKYALCGKSRVYNTVMDRVRDKLKEIYGYEIKTINSDKPAAQHQYFLLKASDADPCYFGLKFSDEQKYVLLLRFMILTHLHMSGGQCTDDSLEEFLMSCGIALHEIDPDSFGDVKKRLVEFQKQNYLVLSDHNEERNIYSMGYRAQQEYDPKSFENWYSKIMRNDESQDEEEGRTQDESSSTEED